MTELWFKGKDAVREHHATVPVRPLSPDAAKGVGPPSLAGNLIIQADNLHALKALSATHGGKVDCVFIDPPYNTGAGGWRYSDNLGAPGLRDWFAGLPVDMAGAGRHDRWCVMMWPRLRLMRDLMAEHATLWMTLDHHELANALAILREIFGADSILAVITTEANPRGRQSDAFFATVNDYLICVAKNRAKARLRGLTQGAEYLAKFNNRDEDGAPWRELGLRQRGADSNRADREALFFPIHVNPETGAVALQADAAHSVAVLPLKSTGAEGRWNWSPEHIDSQGARVYGRRLRSKGGAERWDIFYKDYLEPGGATRRKKPRTIWGRDIANTESGSRMLREIMGETGFPYPKPVALIQRVLEIAAGPDALVLDAFAGSGATAQAVMEANAADAGRRRFILTEMEDFADTLTAERVRRVIGGYAYRGTERTELMREKITWATLKNPAALVARVEALKTGHAARFDTIRTETKDGVLTVTGAKRIPGRKAGLGGGFTFCTLRAAAKAEQG